MEKKIRAAVLLTPPALFLVLFFVLPMCIMATYMFRTGAFGEDRHVFTWQHVKIFFSTPSFHLLLLKTIGQSFLIAVLSVVLAYPVAYFLAFKAGEHQSLLMTLLVIPAWTSYLLRILAWKLILDSTGAVNALMRAAGAAEQGAPLLLYSSSAVVISLVYVCIPLAAVPIFSALETIDPHLLEASADLGGGRLRTFCQVTLPLSFPGVIAGFFFVFIPCLGEWVTPALVGGAQGLMYGNVIQDQFIRTLNWPMGSLMSMVLLFLILPLLLVYARMNRVNEHTTV